MPPKWTTANIPTQQNRRVLITGANSGIGFHTALELARAGAEIILPARSEAKSAEAIARIRAEVPNASLIPETLDLADLTSVKAFATRIAGRFPGQSLDLLINNAGVMAIPKRELTPDGHERHFATNHLGHFALTALLYPHLKQQPGTRIVTVTSSITNYATLRFDNLQSERHYRPMSQAYGQSKVANSLFALELQRRLTAANSPIISTAAHPGYAVTNLQVTGPGESFSLVKVGIFLLQPMLSQPAAAGALPTLMAAVDPTAAPGSYYGPNGFFQLVGDPAPTRIPRSAKNPAKAQRLWQVSEQLTGIPFNL